MSDKEEKIIKGHKVETGYFEDGLPYTRMGTNPRVLVDIEGLSANHAPLSGFSLKSFIKTHKLLAQEYTIYNVTRKPNLPDDYLMDKMADDYAKMIKREFKGPVIVMGVSTGGQIAHYLAADHPDVVKNLVIFSAAYRLSERGVEIERKTEEYARQGRFGKAMAAIMDFMYPSGLKRTLLKFFIRLIAKSMAKEIKYPNDFIVEIIADRAMNFKDRLHEIKAPTLIVSGELDVGYTAEDVRATAEGIPNAELILYKGFGHNLGFSNTEQVQKDILAFLNKK